MTLRIQVLLETLVIRPSVAEKFWDLNASLAWSKSHTAQTWCENLSSHNDLSLSGLGQFLDRYRDPFLDWCQGRSRDPFPD